MINNRQNGRRRGRGGQQARNGQPGVPDRGNRLDNRARGNAAQLLEKYKTLARDAQMQGDRVNTEYYLQFADHYFRVLSENRSRFEEQQQQRRGREDYREDYGSEGDEVDGQRGYGQQADDGWDDGDEEQVPQPQHQSAPRDARPPRQPREFQPRREQRVPEPQREATAEAAAPAAPAPAPARDDAEPRRESRRPRRAANGGNGHAEGELALEAAPSRIEIELPPKLSAEPASEEGDAPKRRRVRKPKAESETVEP